ncbi:septation protein IspZ [Pseudomonas sp. O64]|uniref:septation protein IspZ n=1 Tax=unclassified Pseudomonas TaxID=196821 RepID=UPI001F59701E|nr:MULTISPECIES: septation protein IspZ [unclassified Pseudomonas]UNM17379.1 septation protein IspZ [Pseudomonas sp. ArH3a]UXZ20168.1 septation protein IspZ [Pseudomonas sp. YeP6b]
MIKRRFSLAFSLLWRAYVLHFMYSFLCVIVLGLTFGNRIIGSKNFLLYGPSVALGVYALLLVILEAGWRINLLRAVFGGRLKRSPAEWRTYVLLLTLLITTMATVDALIAFFAAGNVWLVYKLYGGPLLFAVGVFTIGWTQATPITVEVSTAPVENASA